MARGDGSTYLQLPAKASLGTLLPGSFSHPTVPSLEHPLLPSGVPLSGWDKPWGAQGFTPSSPMGEKGIAEISPIPFFSGSGREQEEVGRVRRLPEHRGEARTAYASATHGAIGVPPHPEHPSQTGSAQAGAGVPAAGPSLYTDPREPGSPSLPRLAGHGHASHAAGGDGCFARGYKHGDCGWGHVLCSCVGEMHA